MVALVGVGVMREREREGSKKVVGMMAFRREREREKVGSSKKVVGVMAFHRIYHMTQQSRKERESERKLPFLRLKPPSPPPTPQRGG